MELTAIIVCWWRKGEREAPQSGGAARGVTDPEIPQPVPDPGRRIRGGCRSSSPTFSDEICRPNAPTRPPASAGLDPHFLPHQLPSHSEGPRGPSRATGAPNAHLRSTEARAQSQKSGATAVARGGPAHQCYIYSESARIVPLAHAGRGRLAGESEGGLRGEGEHPRGRAARGRGLLPRSPGTGSRGAG